MPVSGFGFVVVPLVSGRDFLPTHVSWVDFMTLYCHVLNLKTMGHIMDTHVEVFVHKKKKVVITCPNCKLEKEIDVKSIPSSGHRLIGATCKRCLHVFNVSFNLRKYYRKPSNLSGFLFASSDAQEPLAAIMVTDVSLEGVGFAGDAPTVRPDAVLTIRFFLDKSSETEVEREIVIESVRDGHFGARFVETDVFDTVLNKYILTK